MTEAKHHNDNGNVHENMSKEQQGLATLHRELVTMANKLGYMPEETNIVAESIYLVTPKITHAVHRALRKELGMETEESNEPVKVFCEKILKAMVQEHWSKALSRQRGALSEKTWLSPYRLRLDKSEPDPIAEFALEKESELGAGYALDADQLKKMLLECAEYVVSQRMEKHRQPIFTYQIDAREKIRNLMQKAHIIDAALNIAVAQEVGNPAPEFQPQYALAEFTISDIGISFSIEKKLSTKSNSLLAGLDGLSDKDLEMNFLLTPNEITELREALKKLNLEFLLADQALEKRDE